MLKQISLFNIVVGLSLISVPVMAAETTIVQSQQVVSEPGKPPAVKQSTVTNLTVSPTMSNPMITLTPEQLLKLINSNVQLPTQMMLPSVTPSTATTPATMQNFMVNLSPDQLKILNPNFQLPNNMMQIPSAVMITIPPAK